MSAPQNPRSSPSKLPEHASSSTLTPGYSSRRASHYDATHTPDRNGHGAAERGHEARELSPHTRPSDHSPTSVARSQEQEHGIKVHKTRKSGGFLLTSAFRSSPETRQRSDDAKGKRKAEVERVTSTKRTTPYNTGRLNGGSMRSSPLAQVAVSPWNNAIEDGTPSRQSSEVDSLASGALNFEGDGSEHASRESSGEYGPQAAQAPGAFDPAQIVNMALNLSESRRRNFSAGHLLPPATAGGRRAVSAAGPAPSTMLQGSYQAYGTGGSLRQHLQQQRRISRAHSPGAGLKAPGSRHVSSASYVPPLDTTGTTPYHFSDSTLARAEQARQYIELSVEHRRLLQYLPPLKPDSTAPGNSYLTTSSVPGTANVHLHRTQTSGADEKHAMGRNYNPLQLIRNRKLRARTRSSLDPDVEHWYDSAHVRHWIDVVGEASKHPNYRGEDKVTLPRYPLDGSVVIGKAGKGGNETSTPTKRPRMDWFTSPAEHLADAYWLEQGKNKSMIENRHSNRIYPGMSAADSVRARGSFESRHSRTASVAPSAGSHEKEPSFVDSHKEEERGRKHRILRHSRDESRSGLKAVWQKAHRRSKSTASSLSSSDDDVSISGERRRAEHLAPDEDNVGPLELHMNSMLHAESTQSPNLVSPGTPNKWGIEPSAGPMSRAEAHPQTEPAVTGLQRTEATDWVDEQLEQTDTQRPKENGKRLDHHADPRSSFDRDLDTGPNSPSVHPYLAGVELHPSPPASRTTSPSRKSRISMLPFIRSDGLRDGRRTDTVTPQLDDDNRSSRHTSAEVPSKPRSSFELTGSPNRVKNFFQHKGNDSSNSLSPRPSSRGKDTKEIREPDSAVRRFFKGGRIGEIVRHEGAKVGSSFRKKDSPQEATGNFSESDAETVEETDPEDGEFGPSKKRPRAIQRMSSATSEPQPFGKPDNGRFHIDGLPSFRPTHSYKTTSQPGTPGGTDHITHQQRALKHNRSSRFEKLAPPNLDLSHVSTVSSTSADTSQPNTFNTADTSREDRRSSYGFPPLSRQTSRLASRVASILEKPGGVGRAGMPPTGLSQVEEQNRSRPSLSDKRHWSISDQPSSRSPNPTASSSISTADIARVRALFICSGIKAAEISRRAYRPRNPPPLFLRRAAETSGADLRPVRRKEEHVLAARLLTTSLESETSALHTDATHFRSSTIASLYGDLQALKDRVSACVERTRTGSDESVRFGAEIMGDKTIQVRRVVDGLERLARVRRRRLRWVRRVGFGAVEWGVIAFMWWIWLCVFVLRLVWRSVTGVGKVVKWVLWL